MPITSAAAPWFGPSARISPSPTSPRRSPKNVKALRVRCRALTLKGDLPDALADCDRAVELAPEDWRGWFTRGLLREARSERNLALIDFTASHARMPKGLETFPTVARQLKAYGLLTDGADTKDGAPPLPAWQGD